MISILFDVHLDWGQSYNSLLHTCKIAHANVYMHIETVASFVCLENVLYTIPWQIKPLLITELALFSGHLWVEKRLGNFHEFKLWM